MCYRPLADGSVRGPYYQGVGSISGSLSLWDFQNALEAWKPRPGAAGTPDEKTAQLCKIHKKLKPPDRVREAGRRPRRQGPGAVGRAALRRLEVGGHGRELVGLQRHVEQCR